MPNRRATSSIVILRTPSFKKKRQASCTIRSFTSIKRYIRRPNIVQKTTKTKIVFYFQLKFNIQSTYSILEYYRTHQHQDASGFKKKSYFLIKHGAKHPPE